MKTKNRITGLITLGLQITIAVSFSWSQAREKVGVLVLAHGGNETWNQAVKGAATPLQEEYPVEVAYGMANPTTMQAEIDKLESLGVNKIVVVPLFISSYSFIIRQNEYLFKKRD